jgi:hypothetical protein
MRCSHAGGGGPSANQACTAAIHPGTRSIALLTSHAKGTITSTIASTVMIVAAAALLPRTARRTARCSGQVASTKTAAARPAARNGSITTAAPVTSSAAATILTMRVISACSSWPFIGSSPAGSVARAECAAARRKAFV